MTQVPADPAPAPARSSTPVQLLWTGGWDSSFRLLQLLLVEGRPVQPIYVLNEDRASTMQEVRTMQRMRAGLLARLDDPALLAPTQVVIGQEFPPRRELVDMRRAILTRAWVGTQYVMLAAVAEAHGWRGVEICMQAHDEGPTDLHGVVFTDDRGTLTTAPEAQLFASWSFPVLSTTKTRMSDIAREHGFYDLLVQRWFCHHPVLGKPCGRCRPCRLAYRDGVVFAHPALVSAERAARRVRARLRTAGAGRAAR